MADNLIELVIYKELFSNNKPEEAYCLVSRPFTLPEIPVKGELIYISNKKFIVSHRVLIINDFNVNNYSSFKWKTILNTLNNIPLSKEEKEMFKSSGWIEKEESYAFK